MFTSTDNTVKVPVTLITVLSVCGGVVLIAAASATIYLYIQNRKLYRDYTKLKERDVPMDTPEVDSKCLPLIIFAGRIYGCR